jgi:hypothetical protein
MTTRRRLGAAVLGVLCLAGVANAQGRTSAVDPPSRGTFGLAPFAGYLISEPLIEGPLGTSVGTGSGAVYGAQASLPLGANLSLVGTLGYASSDLEAGVPLIGGLSVGDSRTWLFDGALELRPEGWMSSGYRFIPVVQLGGGAIRREVTVAGIDGQSTDFTLSAGLGGDLPLGSNVAVRLMAKDYYGKVDFGDLGQYSAATDNMHTLGLSAGLRIGF